MDIHPLNFGLAGGTVGAVAAFLTTILGIYGFGRLILIFVDIKLTQFAQASLEYEQNQAIYDNSEDNY